MKKKFLNAVITFFENFLNDIMDVFSFEVGSMIRSFLFCFSSVVNMVWGPLVQYYSHSFSISYNENWHRIGFIQEVIHMKI